MVTLLAVLNALQLWGADAAIRGETVIQLGTAAGTFVCGLVAAARVTGPARWWRLAYVASLACFLVTQALRLTGNVGAGVVFADITATVAFALCPVLALTALILLGRSGGSVLGPRRGPAHQSLLTNILDGLVASLAFAILAALGGFAHQLTAAAPNHADVVLRVALGLAELAVVGTGVVMTMVYDRNRPYRTNYLFLAGGMLAMAASYRVVVYLQFVTDGAGARWAGIAFTVGLLMIAHAMLETAPPRPVTDRSEAGTDWPKLVLPYTGFLGTAVLFAFHVFTGRQLTAFAVVAAVLMVFLVTVRQVIAMRAQWQVTERLYWALGHDRLTGLPNRILFAEQLDDAVRDRRFVLILIDLDDFKEINDRFGHAAGDDLLCAVADRLRQCVSDGDTLARIGGDEFAVLIRGDADQLDLVADRLRVALRDPFPVSGSSVRVRASMGVVGPGAGQSETADDLLRHADTSVFAGKQYGKDRAVVYREAAGPRVDFPRALRDAGTDVPAGFHLVYQPIVSLPDERTVAVEALARWVAPNGISVPPETFVAAAEAAGLGAALDALVLDLACRDIAAAGADVDLHVNVGAARLGATGFDTTVARTLARHRIDPGRLVVEVTETVPIVDIGDAASHIERLNAMGVRVALDDFGSGYNSLTYLHSLPVDIVKLDRSLAVGDDPVRDLALYRSVIGLCADLRMMVIAEGIETAGQADIVQAAGCRFAQGYLYGRPESIGELGGQRVSDVRR